MLDAIMATPVLVKVLGSLGLILVVNRFTRNLVASVAIGTVTVAFWSGHPASAAGGIAWARFSSADNLLLMLIIFQVIWLSSQMSAAGVMADLVAAVRGRTGKRASMAVLPAVIGFLPMPGGAIFSAPLVDSVDTDGSVDPRLKVLTNYWFRHIWEYWWPLYPGVLLALAITGLEVWQFMALQLPLTLFSLVVGYVFLLRRVDQPRGERGGSGAHRESPHVVRLVLPILVVIGCYAAVRLGWGGVRRAWPEAPAMNKYLPMAVGLFLAMGVLQWQRPLGWRAWRPILFSKKSLAMAVIVAIIRIYGAFIEADLPTGASLIETMRLEMNAWGIPVLAMMMLIPFLCGITTGVCMGFVGASFPIVVNLVGADAPLGHLAAATTLAYGFGYMGMMLSPVHVCLIVTNEHFRTRLASSLRGLVAPAATFLVLAVGYWALLRALWG